MKRWTHFAHHHSIAAPPMFQPVNGHARLILEASPPGVVNAKVGVGTTALHLATATGKHWLVEELTSGPPEAVDREFTTKPCTPQAQTEANARVSETSGKNVLISRVSCSESRFSQVFKRLYLPPVGRHPTEPPPFPGSDSWHSGNTRTHSLTNNVKTHKHM